MDWVSYLKEVGPFTAPLCLVFTVAFPVVWKRMTTAESDATQLREARASDLQAQAIQFMEQGEAGRAAIKDVQMELAAFRSDVTSMHGVLSELKGKMA